MAYAAPPMAENLDIDTKLPQLSYELNIESQSSIYIM